MFFSFLWCHQMEFSFHLSLGKEIMNLTSTFSKFQNLKKSRKILRNKLHVFQLHNLIYSIDIKHLNNSILPQTVVVLILLFEKKNIYICVQFLGYISKKDRYLKFCCLYIIQKYAFVESKSWKLPCGHWHIISKIWLWLVLNNSFFPPRLNWAE